MNNYLSFYSPFYSRLVFIKVTRLNLRFLWVLGFSLIFFLALFYIFQINQMARNSHLVKIYEKRIETLSSENRFLEIKFAQVNSLANIEEMAKKLNFEKVKKVKYIQILESSLAGVSSSQKD